MKSVDGSYYALIDHDSESRTKVNGYESQASYRRPFKYLINAFADIVEFVNASSSCRQHTKLECQHMMVSSLFPFATLRNNGTPHIGWNIVQIDSFNRYYLQMVKET